MTDVPTNDLSESDRKGLAAVAAAVSAPPRSELASAISDQLVNRVAANMADVHTHALSILQGLKGRITDLEAAIGESRDNTERSITTFVNLVNDSLESAKQIDAAIARVADHVAKP